jgi:serine phosphatase RsbU (regulator of sigma subunit)
VEERSTSNFPIALLNNVVFEVSQISGEPGDVFVILTDGLSEIVDSDDNDLGLEPLKTVLVENASEPLPEIAAHLRRRTLLHGKQVDDQTLLLLRCGANR